EHDRVPSDDRRSEGLHAPVGAQRDPVSASREELPADRELLLHACVRQVLPVPRGRAERRMTRRIHMKSAFRARIGRLVAAGLVVVPAAVQGQTRWETEVFVAEPGEWTGPRLPDGQPDVQGHWSNTIANHNNLTDPQGGIPGDVARAGGGGAAAIGREQPAAKRAPSRVTDPPDGQVPFQPWARAIQQDLLSNFFNPTKEQYIEPLARCAPAGPTKSLMWHGYEIRQYPGYVLFLFDSGTRIIHLDDKPH